jgi:hypothetical protein
MKFNRRMMMASEYVRNEINSMEDMWLHEEMGRLLAQLGALIGQTIGIKDGAFGTMEAQDHYMGVVAELHDRAQCVWGEIETRIRMRQAFANAQERTMPAGRAHLA